mmetsp:Transcript_34079/g.85849  ORF Transcript_34079/g.85849 Transcript_34079/m.85849 type:complete len:638 (+) Transcript_34079:3011-4924(+)
MVLPRHHRHRLLLLQVADQLRAGLVLVVADAQLAVEVAPPGVHAPVRRERQHVRVADGDLHDVRVDVDALRHLHRAAAEVALAELPRLVESPREDFARVGDGGRGELARRQLAHVLLGEPNVARGDGAAAADLADAELTERIPTPHHHLARAAQHRAVPLVHVRVSARRHLLHRRHLLVAQHHLRRHLRRLGGAHPHLADVVFAPAPHLAAGRDGEAGAGAGAERGHLEAAQRLELRGAAAGGGLAEAQLADQPLPPRVDLAVLGDAERVRATGSQRDPVHGRLYLRRRLPWVLFAAGAELPGRVVAKRPQLPLARQRERVRRARHHLRDFLPRERRHQHRLKCVPRAGDLDAELRRPVVPPRVELPAVREQQRVVRAARHVRHLEPARHRHLDGLLARLAVVDAQLTKRVVAPGPHGASAGPRHAVLVARAHARHLLRPKRVDLHQLRRGKLGARVLQPQLAVRVAAPRVQRAVRREREAVHLARRRLAHLQVVQRRDRHKGVAVRVVARPQLPVRVGACGKELPGLDDRQRVAVHRLAAACGDGVDVLPLQQAHQFRLVLVRVGHQPELPRVVAPPSVHLVRGAAGRACAGAGAGTGAASGSQQASEGQHRQQPRHRRAGQRPEPHADVPTADCG